MTPPRPRSPALPWLAGAALVVAAGCGRGARPAAGREVEARVLVLNMHAGADAHGGSNLARVAALVRETGAELVLLQEVDSVTRRSGAVDQVAELKRLTGYAGAFGRTLDYQGGGYGIAVLARAPIARAAVRPLPVRPAQERAGGSYEPRGALVVATSLGGAPVDAVNTHLDPSGPDDYRLQELRTVVAAARERRRGGAPLVLVGGDMNSTPESAVQGQLRASGLRDLWPGCGAGDGLTYPAEAPVKRIDYLYALGPARCVAARVIASEASDHRGVLFTLRLPAR